MYLTRSLGNTAIECFTAEEAKRIQNLMKAIDECIHENTDSSYGDEDRRCYNSPTDHLNTTTEFKKIKNKEGVVTGYHTIYSIYRTDTRDGLFMASCNESVNDEKCCYVEVSQFRDGPWVDRYLKEYFKDTRFDPIDF